MLRIYPVQRRQHFEQVNKTNYHHGWGEEDDKTNRETRVKLFVWWGHGVIEEVSKWSPQGRYMGAADVIWSLAGEHQLPRQRNHLHRIQQPSSPRRSSGFVVGSSCHTCPVPSIHFDCISNNGVAVGSESRRVNHNLSCVAQS